MSPDDPRHGRNAGYDAGCREECCRNAAAAYERNRRYDAILGRPRTLPACGTQRRVQALVALGYTFREIASGLKVSHDRARSLATRPTDFVRTTTADSVKALYRDLSMSPAQPSWQSSYARTVARRNHWLPPLAWDDETIDDPTAEPYRAPERTPGRPELLPQILEDFDWLITAGESTEKAAERVGVALSTIRDYRTRLVRREAS